MGNAETEENEASAGGQAQSAVDLVGDAQVAPGSPEYTPASYSRSVSPEYTPASPPWSQAVSPPEYTPSSPPRPMQRRYGNQNTYRNYYTRRQQ